MYTGIDLALRHTGIVTVDNEAKVIDHHVVKSTVAFSFLELTNLYRTEVDKIERLNSKIVAIENYSYMSTCNMKALCDVAQLKGFLLRVLLRRGFKVYSVAPTQLKKFITGKGNTPKDLVGQYAYKKYGIDFASTDEIEAYALALICLKKENPTITRLEYEAEILDKITEIK